VQLGHKLRIFAPRFEVDTLEVEERQGEEPSHTFKGTGSLVGGYALEAGAVEDFASCLPEAGSVENFTKRFGPLWLSDQAQTRTFSFALSQWVADREQYRIICDRVLDLKVSLANLSLPETVPIFGEAQTPWKHLRATGTFAVSEFGLTYQADTLYSALVVKLLAVSVTGKLRRCLKPNCTRQP
jgi:hypothetical protein